MLWDLLLYCRNCCRVVTICCRVATICCRVVVIYCRVVTFCCRVVMICCRLVTICCRVVGIAVVLCDLYSRCVNYSRGLHSFPLRLSEFDAISIEYILKWGAAAVGQSGSSTEDILQLNLSINHEKNMLTYCN